MLIAKLAILLHFHSAGIRSAVLRCAVVALSTFLAGERYNYPHFISCLSFDLVY